MADRKRLDEPLTVTELIIILGQLPCEPGCQRSNCARCEATIRVCEAGVRGCVGDFSGDLVTIR